MRNKKSLKIASEHKREREKETGLYGKKKPHRYIATTIANS